MKVRTLVYIVIALILVNVAALGTIVYQNVSQRDRAKFRHTASWGDEESRRLFRLSDEERKALKEARANFEATVEPLLDSLSVVRRVMFEELKNDHPDSSIIIDAIEEQGELQTRIQKRLVGRFLSDRDLMKPEHRRFMLEMIEQRARGTHFWGKGKAGGQDYKRGVKRGR